MPERSRKPKNPHAVALGRRGGLVGGKARAARLSSSQRSALASAAAHARWGSTKRSRGDRSPTRERILTAARREFLLRGLDAAHVGRIARAAGVNKRMIYYYFGSKDGLFRELLRRSTSKMMQIAVSSTASTFSEELMMWEDAVRTRQAWVRLSIWEALSGSANWVAASERRDFWRGAIADLERMQREGKLPIVDAAQLQLTLLGIVMFPYLLPQLTELVTGMKAGSDAFRASRASFFRQIESL